MPLDTDRQKGAHLLRRFGLGASEAELDYYLRGGLSGMIDRLLGYADVPEGFDLQISEFRAGKQDRVQIGGVQAWWILRMMQTRRPLQEKMTLFWHNHFATSAEKVNTPMMMYAQNEILRRNCTGNFRTLLSEVSRDPAMLFWLDNQFNIAGKPNENFAREVMELFTLGIGNYTEKDVQQSARAFTGWGFRRIAKNPDEQGSQPGVEFLYRARAHDEGTKNFLGNSGNFNGDDIIDILCRQPRTSVFLTKKIWEWFAYADPEPALIDRLAAKFRDSDLNIATLLREIMRSDEFYSKKAERASYKNPVDFVIASVRQLGVGDVIQADLRDTTGPTPRLRIGAVAAIAQTMKSMGMYLLFPPDVSGWKPGPSWVTTATMVERIAWGERLFGVSPVKRLALRYDSYGLFQKDPTPRGVVAKLVDIFDANVSAANVESLVGAATKASGGQLTQKNANATAAAVAQLLFATPEFQFC